MSKRFTESAIKVIMSAQDEARHSGHNYLGIDFIFLGLIAENKGIAAQILSQHGIALTNARIEIDKILGKGTDIVAEEIPFTQSAKIVLESSVSIADQLGDDFIDTEHLLIGIIREREVISTILESLSIEFGDLVNSVAIYLQQRESNSSARQVYVLLFNVGTDHEEIHSISSNGKETILLFESSEEASNFAQQLKEQRFSMPTVEMMEFDTIVSFCQSSGYDWKFLPSGTNLQPVSNEPTQQDMSLQFLMESLQTTVESKGDKQLFYPWLANNTAKLDRMLADVLRRWGENALREAEADEAQSHAAVINKFSNLIQQFPLGDPASNQEIAIAGYEVVLTIFTESAFPEEWASMQNTLAFAYYNRIAGDKAENLERTIAYCLNALRVYTETNFPYNWASTQGILALAYYHRSKGDRSENIEQAIDCYHHALRVYTETQFPVEWAINQYNLGIAFQNRIGGDKSENIERTIDCYTAALRVYTEAQHPFNWAGTQNNLGNTYRERILGDKAENQERAIACYQATLRVYTQETFPHDWAMTQNNLGNTYKERILGDKAENQERVIACYNAALKVLTQETFPDRWAENQFNLGVVYKKRILGDEAKNQEQTISCYKAALEVYTEENFPDNWARIQKNLGNVYRERILGVKAENIESAIVCYTASLRVHTESTDSQTWAEIQNTLGVDYWNRIRGDKAENIETAIAYYNAALRVYTEAAYPVDRAMVQNNLGLVYIDRIRESKRENIETAIGYFQAALKIYTEAASPQTWAQIQNNLGNAYWNRIKENKANNIETAIACYQTALSVYTEERFPQDWATAQNNLGGVYSERIKGDKTENLENALECFLSALRVHTEDSFPQQWANIQNNLGILYDSRIQGDKAENLENAISCAQAALGVYTESNFPNDWAVAKNTLGMAYIERIQGDRSQNIESAIIHLNEALRVHTKTADPEHWAMIQTNLGIAYQYRSQGKKAENLKKAIVYCQAAITVFTEDGFPDRWAINQNNMGNNYFRLGEKDKNQIELAIACFHAALRVRTEQDFPVEWAKLQSNLGNAYRDRIQGDRSENIEAAIAAHQAATRVFDKSLPLEWAANQSNLGIDYSIRIRGDEVENRNFAIKCYQEALEIRRDTVPQDYLNTALALGLAYELTRNLQEAYNTFKTAIDTVEELREEIVSGNDAKQKLAEQFHILYREMVDVCLELGKYPEALEYAERSKTRNLVELILNQDSNTIFKTDAAQLTLLHNEIAIGQAKIQNGTAENPKAFGQHLRNLRQQRNELQDKYLPVGYGFKLEQFQATLDEQTAVVEWYMTGICLEAFIITRDNVTLCNVERRLKISPPINNQKTLIEWNNEYRQVYENSNSEWRSSLGSRLERLAEILEIDKIIKLIPKHCSRLVLIPHRYLHLFPLHALPLASGELLYEKFTNGVSYAPSCQILQQVQKRERPEFQSLFAIQNPTEDLNYTELEVQLIQSQFSTANVLKRTAATLTAINNTDLNTYHCTHFSCHGYFNLINPGKSALRLANASAESATELPTELDLERYLILKSGKIIDLDKCLTLDKTFALKLEKSRLVTLSACETGLTDFNNTSDEYIGLPSGFLLAGSQSVVSSLWTVDDFSTSFLMMKFYDQMHAINSVSLALNQAQEWLRNLTGDEFKALLAQYDPQIKEFLAQLPEDYSPLAKATLKKISERKPRPFSEPFYWAGFIATGI